MKSMRMLAVAAVIVTAMADVEQAAADSFRALPAPEKRPYPMAIFGIQPGMAADEARALVAKRGIELAPITATMRVTSSAGRTFDTEFTQQLVTPGISPMVRLGSEPFQALLQKS